MQFSQKIAPCLWFDSQGEEAANFYVGIFKNSRITAISRYGKAGQETHKRPEGSVLTLRLERRIALHRAQWRAAVRSRSDLIADLRRPKRARLLLGPADEGGDPIPTCAAGSGQVRAVWRWCRRRSLVEKRQKSQRAFGP